MGSRRALITPQNTFIESVSKRLRGPPGTPPRSVGTPSRSVECAFVIGSARIVDYPILYASDTFYKMTGYERTEVAHRSCSLDFMWDDAATVSAPAAAADDSVSASVEQQRLSGGGAGGGGELPLLRRLLDALERKESFQAEIKMRCKNRAPLWLSYKAYPVTNEKNTVIMFLCILHDITSLKQPLRDDEAVGNGLSRLARLVKQAAATRKDMTVASYARMVAVGNGSSAGGGSEQQPALVAPPSPADRIPAYRPEAPKAAPDILLHYAPFKSAWDWLILLLTVYTSFAVPFFFAFKYKTLNEVPLNIANSIVDVVFFVDLVLNFHTTFGGTSGDVVTDPRVISITYLRTWFAVDLLSCLPYEIFNAFQYSDATTSSALNALKLLRLLRLGRVARKLDHYIEYSAALLLFVLGIFLMCGHWFACIWYVIGASEAARLRYNWLNSLANLTGLPYVFDADGNVLSGGPSLPSAYVTALYFTLSCMTSVGFGNVSSATDAEKAFACCMMILGALLYASIFGNVTAIMQQFVASSSKYRDLLNDVKQFAKLYRIPRELSERISDYVVSLWVVTKGIDHSQILDHCPKDMRADVSVHLHRKVLKEHPGFRLASDGCLRALALQFTIVHCAPGDLLYHQGESVDQLCFIVSGSLEVVQDDEVVAILGVGDTFGDDFWNHNGTAQSSGSVRAMTYCSIHSIKRDKLLQVLDFYQAFYSAFKRNMTVSYSLRSRFTFRKIGDDAHEKEEQDKLHGGDGRGAKNHFVRKFLTKLAQSVVNLQDGDRVSSASATAAGAAGAAAATASPANHADATAEDDDDDDTLALSSAGAPPSRDTPPPRATAGLVDAAAVAATALTIPTAAAAGAGRGGRAGGVRGGALFAAASGGSDAAVATAMGAKKSPTAIELQLFRSVVHRELEELSAKLGAIERHVLGLSADDEVGASAQRQQPPPPLRQSTVSEVSTAHILLEGADDADRRCLGGASPRAGGLGEVGELAAAAALLGSAVRLSRGVGGGSSSSLAGGGDRKSPKRTSPLGKKTASVHPAPTAQAHSSATATTEFGVWGGGGADASMDLVGSRGGAGASARADPNSLPMRTLRGALAGGGGSNDGSGKPRVNWRETDLDLI